MESADMAQQYALAVLEQHLDLLAPGADIADFVLVTNHTDGTMRTVGFTQHRHGMRVLGGQVSFRFKADRLFVIGSEAMPEVRAPTVREPLATADIHEAARAWLAQDAGSARVTGSDGPHILPVVTRARVAYHTVYRVTVEAHAPRGRWHVFIDAHKGTVVAREQLLHFASGTLEYGVPERHPASTRLYYPARNAEVQVDGVTTISDADGVLTWPAGGNVDVTTAVTGPLVDVVSEQGLPASDVISLLDGGSAQWEHAETEFLDAQLTAFIHAGLIKEYSRSFAPNLEFLDGTLEVTVNIDDTCNAFSDGLGIFFFTDSLQCENTARLADVVYHEFGHSLHRQSILDGVGAPDGGFGEGLSDYLAATYTGDPGMGRGFFHDDDPLRDLDPPDSEAHWPEDIGEVHATGLIFGGAMWDLRKSLIAKYGEQAGVELANRLFYAAVQRAVDSPTTYIEILAADDDDGDLDNGTPNECEINHDFGTLHGLRILSVDHQPLGRQGPELAGYELSVQMPVAPRCPGDAVESVVVDWGQRAFTHSPPESEPLDNELQLSEDNGLFTGQLPAQRDGAVVRYRFTITLADGSTWQYPNNRADTAYEFYVGEVTPLYCHDFESDPFADDWTRTLETAATDVTAWEWGAPQGLAQDPAAAYSGTGIIGIELGAGDDDGVYQNLSTFTAMTPEIDTQNYSDVRLQYRRWLTVEDSIYDVAEIQSNGNMVWRNLGTMPGDIHHIDEAWVFHDVPLSEFIFENKVQVSFVLESDPGLEFGGWNVDDVCIVANPAAICGDGQVVGIETCDDGENNSNTEPNACRGNCQAASCGDGVVDSGEECDDANDDPTDDCNSSCRSTVVDEGCGCTVGGADRDPVPAALALGLFGLVLLRRRRR